MENDTSKPMVFIVDDDDSVLDSLSVLAMVNGLGTKCFKNPSDFLVEIGESCCDCAIVDLRMPEMSGIELQTELSQRGITTPLILMSGDSNDQQRQIALKNGAVQFFHKPVDGRRLIETIKSAIHSSS